MHISDGVLSAPVWIGGYVAAVSIAAVAIKKTKQEEIPKIAVMTSVFFVASLIHIPLGPTSVHLILNGLAGVILGVAAFPSILLGLMLQCLLFQHGGLTSLGANAIMMGCPALVAFVVFKARNMFKFKHKDAVFGALAGAVAIILNGFILAALLVTAGEEFIGVAKYAFMAHLPVMIVESAITAFAVTFLNKVKPELLNGDIISHK